MLPLRVSRSLRSLANYIMCACTPAYVSVGHHTVDTKQLTRQKAEGTLKILSNLIGQFV